jgi:hypothetical protein
MAKLHQKMTPEEWERQEVNRRRLLELAERAQAQLDARKARETAQDERRERS